MRAQDGQGEIDPGGTSSGGPIRRMFTGDWLPRLLIESTLIVFSILLALGVSEWEAGREQEELAAHALTTFRREVRQNKARLEDAGPYRRGLREVIARMAESDEPISSNEFHRTIGLEALRPAFLTSTVWETALTTGAIPYIDFDVVNALSLTYSLQARLEEFARTGMPTLARGGYIPEEDMPGALREVAIYLGELGRSEVDLLAAYDEVLRILDEALRETGDRQVATGDSTAAPVPRP